MKLHELTCFQEERKNRKRVGRGSATGWGCTCGKGNKGQLSRSGYKRKAGFEGGQMPLQRRLPKRGFKNALFKVNYQPINLERLLSFFDGDTITLDDIYDRGLARRNSPVKILSGGDVTRAVTVQAHRFSAAAAEKITQAGGKAEALEQSETTEG